MVVKMDSFKKISLDLSFLVNIAIASAKIKKLVVEEKHKRYNMRPVIHIILHAPVGQIKSTILNEISDITKTSVITEATKAGLVGTLDNKTMQIIAGAAWECRNSLLLLDEFNFGRKKEGWEVFLQLLEHQKWGKRIGMFGADQNISDEDLYFKTGKGRIDLKTRFSAIIATMRKFESQRSQGFRAFASRCIPMHFDLSENDMKRILEGESLFKYKNLPVKEEVSITGKTYRKIKNKVLKELKTCCPAENVRKEIIMRSVGDCCRAYAVLSKNDKNYNKKIVNWKAETQQLIGKYFMKVKK